MSKKQTRSKTKQIGLGKAAQVRGIDMEEKSINSEDLSVLIRTIIREEINVAIDKLQPQLDAIKKEVTECSSKVAAIEEALNQMETRVTALETAKERLCKENTILKEKAERLENHSRKYNIRILGLTQDIEKGNPTSYVSALLSDLFRGKLQSAPEVENAHRVGPVPTSGQRVMIVRMHRLATREEVLRIAKRDKVFEIRGMRLRIFADLTAETVRARARFHDVRSRLWSAGVKHGIIHPATLILTFKGQTEKFTDHLAAEKYFETVIKLGTMNQDAGH